MRILIVSLRGPTQRARRGGAQDYIRAVSSQWVREGHSVTVLCGQERLGGSTLPDEETVEGVCVVRAGTPTSRAWPLIREARQRAAHADVVVENIMAFPLGLPWVLPSGTPLLAIKHHFQGHAFVRSQGRIRGTFGRAMESGALPFVYRDTPLVVPSVKTADHVRRLWVRHRADLHVIPPPVRLPPAGLAAAAEQASRPTILYLGALHLSRKRVDHLIRAFREVSRKVPDAKMIVAGDGPDRAALEAQAAGLAVEFTGFVSEEDKRKLLSRAWVFASPSVQEGFGITWIEAGAHGLPLVGYRVDGLDTVDASSALLVEAGDVHGLAASLLRLLADDSLRQRLSAGALINAQRFDPESSSRALLRAIEQATRDAGRREAP